MPEETQQDTFARSQAADFGRIARRLLLDEDVERPGRAARIAASYARLALRNESVEELERQQHESVGLEAGR